MAENQNHQVESPAFQGLAPQNVQAAVTQAKDNIPPSFFGLVKISAEYSLFMALILYSLGFLIWHSYLAPYGLSSIGFLQAEYIAAAFCYLVLIASLAVGPVLLLGDMFAPVERKHNDKWFFSVFVCWALIWSLTAGVYFPEEASFSIFKILLLPPLVATGGLHLVAIIAVKGRKPHVYNKLVQRELFWMYAFFFVLSYGFCRPSISAGFVLTTFFMIGAITSIWVDWFVKTKILNAKTFVFAAVAVFIVIMNVQTFAKLQFQTIPKAVGGGKPEKAFFKLSHAGGELASFWGLSKQTNTIQITNGFAGPVGILIRSEKELIFIDYYELEAPKHITNRVTNVVTKISTNETRKLVMSYLTNASSIMTNWTTNAVISYSTNIATNYTTKIVKNPVKVGARQIRADLVDSIHFFPE